MLAFHCQDVCTLSTTCLTCAPLRGARRATARQGERGAPAKWAAGRQALRGISWGSIGGAARGKAPTRCATVIRRCCEPSLGLLEQSPTSSFIDVIDSLRLATISYSWLIARAHFIHVSNTPPYMTTADNPPKSIYNLFKLDYMYVY